MKKFLALVLALLMALSCFSFAGAEGETSTTPGSEEYNCAKDGHVAAGTDEGKLVTKATCTNLEAREYTCIKCKEKFTREIPGTMLAHEAADDDKVNYVDATCTSAAYYEHTHCKNCGQAYTVTDTSKPAKNHSWKDVTVVKPTCTTDGYTEQKCELCGATQKANVTTKLGHVWSNTDKAKELMEGKEFDQFQEYYKAPTCLEYGYEGKAPYCVREGCTAVKEDESTLKQLDKLTHTAKDNGQPNAYGDAYDKLMDMFFTYEGKNCIGSKQAEGKDTITKKEHNLPYGDLSYEYKAPTCADDGFVTVTCECGWTVTEKIAKLDHKYLTDGNTHKIPALKDTAYKAGDNAIYVISVKYLDKNGEVAAVYDMMPPVGAPDFKPDHYMDLFDCTMEMVAHYECDICGKTWDGETFCFTEHQYAVYSVAQTDVKGHAHSDVVNNEVGEADYTKVTMPEWLESCHDFDVTYKCVRCQQTKTETVKGTGHDIDKPYMVKGEDYKKGTCTVPGSYFVTCSKCQTTLIVNKTETEPHTWERTELVNNTCTTDGKRVFTCKVCGATKTEIIPATGHEEYLAKTEAATCEKTGLKTYKCARCGEVTRTEVLNRAHVVAKKSDVKVNENCTVSFKQITDKDSKDYMKWTLTYTWDDCTKDGKLQFICAHCNLQTITYTGKADHNWELKDTVVADKPYTFVDDETCQQNFVEIYQCKDCAAGKLEKNLKKVNISKKAEHELSTAATDCKVIKYARCGVAGEKVVKCEHCNEWVKVTIPAADHVFKTTWDAKNNKWTYTCEDCGYVEDIEFTAPRFVIDASKIDWANKTTGKGYVKLENETVPTFVHPVVYLRWTWVTKDGCDVVADKVVELDEDENGYFFNAKGYNVSGATLSELLIIVTDDANADEMNLSAINKLGYTVVKK